MTAMPAANVMARLRQDTAALHDAIEALPLMRRLVDPQLKRAEYLDVLRCFYRANRICEGHLLDRARVWESRGLDWSSRLNKTAWLEEDLRRLDPNWLPSPPDAQSITATCSTPARYGEPAPMPYHDEGFARAAGCLYVMEGATLGSRVILGLLGRARERPAAGATRFFQGYGPLTGERWATLGRELQSELGQDEAEFSQALEAANETYAFLRTILGAP